MDGVKAAEKPTKDKKGRTFKVWFTIIFSLSCIAAGLEIFTPILPVFFFLIGFMLMMVWFIFVIILTAFTLGGAWAADGISNFVGEWWLLCMNTMQFGIDISDKTDIIIPIITFSVFAIMAAAWVLEIIGLNKFPERKRFFKKFMIALIITTSIVLIFGAIALFSIYIG